MKLVRITLTAALALVLSGPASAIIIPLTSSMDGAQADAGDGTGSPGIGSADITFDTDTNLLSWSIEWSGLIGTPSLMHFHGAALPNQHAGVQVSTGVAGPPVIGNAILLAGQVDDLLADLWYLNLHTTAYGGGEIRGQVTVVPEPGTIMLLAAGLGILGVHGRTRQD